jgi:site-specific recombinase XerD
MTCHFKLKAEKSSHDGFMTIVLFVFYKNSKFQFHTTEKLLPKYFDEKKERVRRSHPSSTAINQYLEGLENKCKSIYRDYLTKGIFPPPILIKTELSGGTPDDKPKQKLSFLEVFELFKADRKATGFSAGTIKAYQKMYNHLESYEREVGVIPLDGFDQKRWQHFVIQRTSVRDYHPNTIASWVKYLKAFFNWAKASKYELGEHATLTKSEIESDIIHLTMDEVLKIMNVPLPPNLGRIRDSFVFACFTGLRYEDLQKMEKSNVIDVTSNEVESYKALSFYPSKSLSSKAKKIRKLEVPLVKVAQEIVEKYWEQLGNQLLPVISNQKFNKGLKEIARLAGVDGAVEVIVYRDLKPVVVNVEKWTLVTCHVARHSFATVGLINGIPIETISKLLGHADTSTTLIYAKIVQEIKAKQLNTAFGHVSLN